MKNVLVLENVSHLEPEMQNYLVEYHKDDKLNLVFSLSSSTDPDTKQLELVQGLKIADELVVSSSFYNTEQFETILKMIINFKNIKTVRIHYLYTKNGDSRFMSFLNDLDQDLKPLVVKLSEQCKIYEICSATYELADSKNEYFSRFKYTYDVVEVYYNTEYSCFWHVRQPLVPSLNTFLYKEQIVTTDVKKTLSNNTKLIKEAQEALKEVTSQLNGKAVYVIDKKYASAFTELLLETNAFVENQIESCKQNDFGDSKELIKEKKVWLKILNNIKKV